MHSLWIKCVFTANSLRDNLCTHIRTYVDNPLYLPVSGDNPLLFPKVIPLVSAQFSTAQIYQSTSVIQPLIPTIHTTYYYKNKRKKGINY